MTGGIVEASPCITELNWSRVAQIMVHRTAQLINGEAAVILYDAARNPRLVNELRDEIVRAGGVLLAELPRPSASQQSYWASLPPDARFRRQAAEDALYGNLLTHADVLFWLDVGVPTDRPKRWERLLQSAEETRAIHFHWFMPDDPAERCATARMYLDALKVARAGS